MPPTTPARSGGLAWAVAAYLGWGLFPLYFRLLAGIPPLEILAHRVIWSAGFLVLLLTALSRWKAVVALVRAPRKLGLLAASAVLLSFNWLIFIWAVNAGHVLDSSLGYFINPLVNVLLGVLFLRERLTRPQVAAVGLAAAGVLALVVRAGHVPWVSLSLAATFGGYGLLRKVGGVDAVAGLFVETLILAPAAGGWLAWLARAGTGHFAAGGRQALLLAAAGAVTAVPLIWFALGVQRLRLATVGLLQYISPSMQFAVAVFAFGETFTAAHGLAFGCIWVSLAIYSADALQAARRAEAAGQAARPAPRASSPRGGR
jgi:chloramphenicol-sensitive protein RarD